VAHVDGPIYVRKCADGPSRWPDADFSEQDGAISLDIMSRHHPRFVRVLAWALAVDGDAVGPAEELSFVERRRGRAWRIRTQLQVPCRDYYIELHTLWDDAEGGGIDQDAIWQFHFRRPVIAGAC
jgi:hypothetical protein